MISHQQGEFLIISPLPCWMTGGYCHVEQSSVRYGLSYVIPSVINVVNTILDRPIDQPFRGHILDI